MSELDDFFDQVEGDFTDDPDLPVKSEPKKPVSARGIWSKMRNASAKNSVILPPLTGVSKADQSQLGAINQLIKKHGAEEVTRVGLIYASTWHDLKVVYNLNRAPSAFQFVKLFPSLAQTGVDEEMPGIEDDTDLSSW